ncbi:multiple epidermal growth factor-like domains protein 10 [Mya arenaria]|uniref:multiple epidermal growth factor-like domains protein 10 n=1 Tax=Mya arenaria TaxID=6604 RepID=UPI0022E58B3A|nr:multiple epidermal growth factor-like domains protein 10 [Mya arenaria]
MFVWLQRPLRCKACDTCLPEYFGSYCNQTCSKGCLANKCNDESGVCVNGCLPQYIGDKCDQCTSGLWGEDTNGNLICSSTCNEGCANNACNDRSGICYLGCKPNWFGYKCNAECSTNCRSDEETTRCSAENGTCYGECLEGFFDHDCSKKCDDKCLNAACDRLTGECTNGCQGDMKVKGSSCVSASVAASLSPLMIPLSVGAGALVVIAVLIVALVCTLRRIFHRKREQRCNDDNEVVYANSSTPNLKVINKPVKTRRPVPTPESSAYSETSLYVNTGEGIGNPGYENC